MKAKTNIITKMNRQRTPTMNTNFQITLHSYCYLELPLTASTQLAEPSEPNTSTYNHGTYPDASLSVTIHSEPK